jgi:uncharacterized membrane protein
MTNESPPPAQPSELRPVRLEAFSDGVFAIAITLLVLEISVPLDTDVHPLEALIAEWPSYLAYVVSFATIGALWLGHASLTEHLSHADMWLLRLNLLLLLVVALLPFPTRLLADSIEEHEVGRVSGTVYGLTLLAATALLSTLWRYSVRYRLVRPETRDDEVLILIGKLTPGIGGYLGLIVLGIFFPVPAAIGYLGVALYYLVPFGALTHGGEIR